MRHMNLPTRFRSHTAILTVIICSLTACGSGDTPTDTASRQQYQTHLHSYRPFANKLQALLDAVYMKGPITLQEADKLIQAAVDAAKHRSAAPAGFDTTLDDLEARVPQVIKTVQEAFNAAKNLAHGMKMAGGADVGEMMQNEQLEDAVARAKVEGHPSYDQATPEQQMQVLKTMVDVKWEAVRDATNECKRFLNHFKQLNEDFQAAHR